MNKIVRILNIRRHKNVSFLDVSGSLGTRLQLLCYSTLLGSKDLSVGDIISFNGAYNVTNNGNPIIEIKEIVWRNPAIEWNSPKGVYNSLNSSLEEIRYNARNAGKQLSLLQGRLEVFSLIKNLLVSEHFLEVDCKVVESHRTSARRNPLKVHSSNDDSPLFLRITMENQLKQYCAITLRSVFSIDNVFYDKFVTANVDREVSILELVSIEHSVDDLINLVVEIDDTLRLVFATLHLDDFGYTLPERINIVDYSSLVGKTLDYKTFPNTIIKNVPVDSPFVRKSISGLRTEFQWIVKGKMLAHGYEDEFEYNNLLNAVLIQKKELCLNTCNEMDYMKYAVPRTTSFGLGLDQLMYRFWGLEHIVNISNPIGIYSD